ncbi:helix-turn-helix domain-containing protein [Massilia arenosa]|uniref:Helix-turn-helix domain-containing protein n=1 Tax=Zemynaea arenosa TaxID=2561931 RepID=A0A4Y9RQT9_9BURK|nr:GAF domain-containing protein [Massilia arenosa]TFW10651.1 helix-turn-helix domain-containing protein [Massilia arenosa]
MGSSTPPDPILTTRQAAELLGVAVSTAQLWMESGAIPSWKTPGGHRRTRRSDVLQVLGEREVRHPQAIQWDTALADEFLPALQPAYPVPDDEAARLSALREAQLVGTPDEWVFDRLTWLAAQVTDSPMALMTLLTARRQWFKSRTGVELRETPRSWAFCSYALLGESMVVEDALQDPRFRENPLVTGEPHIRFYAGFPLQDAHGFRLGTLCVLDREARKLRERELKALRELAIMASEEIQRRTGH